MGFDANKKTGQHIDEYGMMMGENPDWNPNGDAGMGDSIGTTLDAYLAYDHEPFARAVRNCFEFKCDNKGHYIQGYRHPSLKKIEYNDLSRDHILNSLILMKVSNNGVFLKYLSKYLRWKISDRYSFTIDLWLWMKGISGNRFAMFAYYLVIIPVMFFSMLLNKIIYLLAGIGKEVPQDEYVQADRSKFSKFKLYLIGLIYPMYTLAQTSFMMYVTPNSLGKWLLKKICLWGVDEQNFLLRIMFGGKISAEEVYGYKAMNGWRWSTYLNELNDRDLYVITDPKRLESNVLDVDLLRKMYEKLK